MTAGAGDISMQVEQDGMGVIAAEHSKSVTHEARRALLPVSTTS